MTRARSSPGAIGTDVDLDDEDFDLADGWRPNRWPRSWPTVPSHRSGVASAVVPMQMKSSFRDRTSIQLIRCDGAGGEGGIS
jgi:hypothetical protein